MADIGNNVLFALSWLIVLREYLAVIRATVPLKGHTDSGKPSAHPVNRCVQGRVGPVSRCTS